MKRTFMITRRIIVTSICLVSFSIKIIEIFSFNTLHPLSGLPVMLTGQKHTWTVHSILVVTPRPSKFLRLAKEQNLKSDKINLAAMACTWVASLVVWILFVWLADVKFSNKKNWILDWFLWMNICHDSDQSFTSKPRLSSQRIIVLANSEFIACFKCNVLVISLVWWRSRSCQRSIHILKWNRPNEQLCERTNNNNREWTGKRARSLAGFSHVNAIISNSRVDLLSHVWYAVLDIRSHLKQGFRFDKSDIQSSIFDMRSLKFDMWYSSQHCTRL